MTGHRPPSELSPFMETLLSEQTLDERTLDPQNPFAEPTRDPQDHIVHWLANVDGRYAPENAATECSSTESPSSNRHAMRSVNNSVAVTLPSEQPRRPLRTAEGAWDASSDSDSDESSEAAFEYDYNHAHPMQGKEDEETLHPLDAHLKTGEAIDNIRSNDNSLQPVADSTEAPRVQQASRKESSRQPVLNNYIDLVTALRHEADPSPSRAAPKPLPLVSPPVSPPKFTPQPIRPWQFRRRHSAPGKLAGGKQQLSLKGQHQVNGTTFFRSEKVLEDDPFVTAQSPPNHNDLGSRAVSDSSDSGEPEIRIEGGEGSQEAQRGSHHTATPGPTTYSKIDLGLTQATPTYTTHRVAIFKAMAKLEKEKEMLRRETAVKLKALDREVKALAFDLRRIPPYF